MGDRANFGFKQSNDETIVLYGHWAGHEMLANLDEAVETAQGETLVDWAQEMIQLLNYEKEMAE